jgi:uncharacterized circularly permuted ATP-grasp superfamily protein
MERWKMNIAEKYFKKQLSSDEFRRSFLEEKIKLDIEYRLEELKRDIQTRKSPEELIKKVDSMLRYLDEEGIKYEVVDENSLNETEKIRNTPAIVV